MSSLTFLILKCSFKVSSGPSVYLLADDLISPSSLSLVLEEIPRGRKFRACTFNGPITRREDPEPHGKDGFRLALTVSLLPHLTFEHFRRIAVPAMKIPDLSLSLLA